MNNVIANKYTSIQNHKSNCQCAVCMIKRGEYKKKRIEISKKLLYQEYIVNKKSYSKIANEYNYKPDTVRRRLKDCSICLRNSSEAQKGKKIKHKLDCQCCICKARRGETKGENSPRYKEGRYSNGKYIFIYMSNHPRVKSQPYVMEHILVMEEKISRYLKPLEVVHHINEIKDDNRIENLQLMTDSKHKSLHNKRRWKNNE